MPINRHHSTAPEQVHLLHHAEPTPAHSHTRGHLVYPASGVLAIATDAGSWIAPPNRTVWIPAGFTHQHRAHGATDMRIVFLPARLVGRLLPRPAVLGVTPLAREAMLALTGRQFRGAAALDRLRGVIIDELAVVGEEPLHLPEPHDPRMREVARMVEHDIASPARLAELGKRIGASERTLSRLFRQETGMGFRQWRTQLRVQHALLQLADGRSVLDVATACGWANPSMFIDAFTQLVGQTPGAYQRALHVARDPELPHG